MGDFKAQREDADRQAVASSQDPLQQDRLARLYLKRYGRNGRYTHEIEPIIAIHEQAEHLQKNQGYLAEIKDRIALIVAGQDPFEIKRKTLEELQKQTGQLPYPESVLPVVIDQQDDVRRGVTQELLKIGNEENERRQHEARTIFVKRYHELMQQREVVSAWHHLKEMPAPSPELSRLEEDFKARLTSILREKYLAILTNTPSDWSKAREVIDEVRNAPALLITLTAEQQKALNKIRSEIDTREDQTLYDNVVRRKERQVTALYLQQAPLQTMSTHVRKFQEYLDRRAAPLALTLELTSIDWGNTWNNNNNLVTVAVNGTKIIEQNNVRSQVNTPMSYSGSASILSAPFTTKLHEPIRLTMKIVSKGAWDGDAGQGAYDRKVEDLNGYRIPLEGDGHKNFAVFRVSGLPSEPSLPAWGTP